MRRSTASGLLAVAVTFTVAGCTGYDRFTGTDSNELDDNGPPEITAPEPAYDPPPAPVPAPAPEPAYWTCFYDPTFNDDWHDDVVCSNGSERHRPYLRAWDSFVTEDEIAESALEYENELNAGTDSG